MLGQVGSGLATDLLAGIVGVVVDAAEESVDIVAGVIVPKENNPVDVIPMEQ